MSNETHHQGGQKYFVNIEGTDYPWHEENILTEEIRNLGNLPQDLPVVEEFPDGTEITLRAGEVVHLKPGHRFGRAPKFKRG